MFSTSSTEKLRPSKISIISLSEGGCAPGKMRRSIQRCISLARLRPIVWISPRPLSFRLPTMTRPSSSIVLHADVLEHADRDELVVVARDVAIVVLDELDLVRQALLLGALLRVRDLLARDVERAHLHAVVTRHVQRQRTPAATRLDDALAAVQANLAADVIHLGDLRLVERRRRRRKVRARVRHRRAEPERIELVADVVVMMNVLARAVQRVARPTMAPLREAARERHRLRGSASADVQLLDHAQDAAVHVDPAGAVQLAELQVRVGAQAQQRATILDVQRRNGS